MSRFLAEQESPPENLHAIVGHDASAETLPMSWETGGVAGVFDTSVRTPA
jgi:hypothetical protein